MLIRMVKRIEGDSERNFEKKVVQTSVIPPVPFSSRLQSQKLKNQFAKFMEIFTKLHINILFAEALEQMPRYVKFMKDILSKKRKLGEFKTVVLTEECSAVLQQKLPLKLEDLGALLFLVQLVIKM